MGIAIITHTILKQTNARLSFLPIRAHSTTDFFANSFGYPADERARSENYNPLSMYTRKFNLNPLNKGQAVHERGFKS